MATVSVSLEMIQCHPLGENTKLKVRHLCSPWQVPGRAILGERLTGFISHNLEATATNCYPARLSSKKEKKEFCAQ